MSTPIEHEAVQALWEVSSQRLRAWFERRTGNPHDAEDLVQETFLRVQEKLSSLRDHERLGAWVGTIAANVLTDHGRRSPRKALPLEEGDGDSLPAASFTSENEDVELKIAVAGWIEAFLGRLDRDDAGILRAVDIDGRAQVDVARELGLAPSSARSRVQRARSRLKKHLEACCKFAFDAHGNLTDAQRRPGGACDCDSTGQGAAC